MHRQLLLCDCWFPLPSKFFLTDNEEEERLFDILARAYIQGRYVLSFEVAEGAAVRLLLQVSHLWRWRRGRI
jgi:hypothetical protein